MFIEGVITVKEFLPITHLNFGGTGWPLSHGNHTLGKFNCSGIQEYDQMPRSCDDLKRIGHTLSGFFYVKGVQQIRLVYCKFSKNTTISGRKILKVFCQNLFCFIISLILLLTDEQDEIGGMD